MAHLWEAGHPYECHNARREGAGTHDDWNSWEDFTARWWTKIDNYQVLVRWDWIRDPDGDVPDELRAAFLGQRKGMLHTHSVQVTEADEDAVKAWLQLCAEKIREMWAPFL